MIGDAENSLRVGFILREQERHVGFTREIAFAEMRFDCLDDARSRTSGDLLQSRPLRAAFPRPFVAEPKRRQYVQLGRFRAAVIDADLDQDVFRRFLGIFDEHVEIAVLIEHSRIEQFVFELIASAATVRLDKIAVRESSLRVLVEVLHVRMGRSAVEVKVVFLDILAVIAFAVGEAEQALLEDCVLAGPSRGAAREAEPLLIVGDSRQAIFAPAIGARAGLIVREIIPGVAPFAIVLADGSPLPLAEVRTPFLPGGDGVASLVQSDLLIQASHFSTHLS